MFKIKECEFVKEELLILSSNIKTVEAIPFLISQQKLLGVMLDIKKVLMDENTRKELVDVLLHQLPLLYLQITKINQVKEEAVPKKVS